MADSDDDELLAEAKRRIKQQLENPDPQWGSMTMRWRLWKSC